MGSKPCPGWTVIVAKGGVESSSWAFTRRSLQAQGFSLGGLIGHPSTPWICIWEESQGSRLLAASPKPDATKVILIRWCVGSRVMDGSFCVLALEAHIPAKSMPHPRALSPAGPQEILIGREDQRVKFTPCWPLGPCSPTIYSSLLKSSPGLMLGHRTNRLLHTVGFVL